MTQTRLPVVGSSAATTVFCSALLPGPGGFTACFDGNGKITASNGTLHEPKPNAFSLPSQGCTDRELIDNPEFGGSYEDIEKTDCPGATDTCRKSCYVENLKKAQPDLYSLYEQNAKLIRAIVDNVVLGGFWAAIVAKWITENAAGGFRWHVSGDVTSMKHAEWIAEVCRQSPTVRHWIYTRSFEFLEPLVKVSTMRGGNLALNLSCDKDNYVQAWTIARCWNNANGMAGTRENPTTLRLCYLTTDGKIPDQLPLRADDVIFPDYALRPRQFATLAESPWWQSITPFQRGLVCPVDAHGKDEKRRCGPCDRCMK